MSDTNIQAGSAQEAQRAQAGSDLKDSQNEVNQIKNQCQDCLTSSLQKAGKENTLNKKEAIEKLELIKETTQNEEIKNKMDQLMTQVEQARNTELNDTVKIKAFLEQSFQNLNTQKPELQNAAVMLGGDDKNPFKTNNPFGPQLIKATSKMEKTETGDTKTKPQEQTKPEEQEEKPSLWKRIKGIFG
jgi:hypothetical protein